jgi:hypothetical protein
MGQKNAGMNMQLPRDRTSLLAQAPSVKSPVLVIQIMRTRDFIPDAVGHSEFAATFRGMAEGDVPGACGSE